MRNDSIDTLLLRHYGSNAPAPVNLEQQLGAIVRAEAVAEHPRQQKVNGWNERRISRRRVLQLVTFTSASVSALAVGINAIQGSPRKSAFSL